MGPQASGPGRRMGGRGSELTTRMPLLTSCSTQSVLETAPSDPRCKSRFPCSHPQGRQDIPPPILDVSQGMLGSVLPPKKHCHQRKHSPKGIAPWPRLTVSAAEIQLLAAPRPGEIKQQVRGVRNVCVDFNADASWDSWGKWREPMAISRVLCSPSLGGS